MANQNNTPSDVLRLYIEAVNRNDAEGIKSVLSENTLRILKFVGEQQRIEVLRDDADVIISQSHNPEIGEEQIYDDTATVEMKNSFVNRWEKMPFIKEDGVWKFALDIYLESRGLDGLSYQVPENN